jgi:hypothetical protein
MLYQIATLEEHTEKVIHFFNKKELARGFLVGLKPTLSAQLS